MHTFSQPYGHQLALSGVGALSIQGTNMIDETQHLKVGFSTYAASVADGADAPWQRQTLQNESITFAKIKRDGDSVWEMMHSSIWGLDKRSMIDYRKGAVYEAETKKRSIHGKTISAEKYLDFYDSLPLICITTLPCYKLQAWVDFEDLEKELAHESARGIEIATVVPFQDEGHNRVRVEIPLTSATQILYFLRAFSQGKRVSLISTGLEPEPTAPALLCNQAQIYTETMSLF